MTELFEHIVRRLRATWVVLLRGTAAGVFGLAIALTVAVSVAGPETRDEWRALPARVASGEVSIPVVGSLLVHDGAAAAEARDAQDRERAKDAASRGSGVRAPGAGGTTSPFSAGGSQPFVASGVPAAPAAPATPAPEPEPVPEAVVPPADPAPVPDPTVDPAPAAAAPAQPKAATAPPKAAPAPSSSAGGMNETATEVLRLVNVERVQAGCGELRPDSRLNAAAQLHSEDMSANNYMSHTSLDGRSAGDRAKAQGYDSFSGENVAKGYRSAADVMKGWMNSPGHRANILNCSSQTIGIGIAGDAWTQVFGYV